MECKRNILIFSSLALCLITSSINAAEEKPKEVSQEARVSEISPLYTQIMYQWVKTTHFAENAAKVISGKLKQDYEKNPKMKAALTSQFLSDIEQFFYELFLSPETINRLAHLYADYFSVDEMAELLKFYQTPLGQKLIKNDPALQLKTQAIGAELLKKHEAEYMLLIQKYVSK